jgi:alpha-tubulin suppressor-like RCC1 family protein
MANKDIEYIIVKLENVIKRLSTEIFMRTQKIQLIQDIPINANKKIKLKCLNPNFIITLKLLRSYQTLKTPKGSFIFDLNLCDKNIIDIKSGLHHILARSSDGRIYCLGNEIYSESDDIDSRYLY